MLEQKITGRERKFGWGWATTPTGQGTEIEHPGSPDVTGSIKFCLAHKHADPAFQSLGGTFYSTAWFFNLKRITHTWMWGLIREADPIAPYDPDGEESYSMWCDRDDKNRWDNNKYDWVWREGFDPNWIGGERTIKIRTE